MLTLYSAPMTRTGLEDDDYIWSDDSGEGMNETCTDNDATNNNYYDVSQLNTHST